MKPHELANLIFRYNDYLGIDSAEQPTLLNFALWLKEQDTNTNPYRYRRSETDINPSEVVPKGGGYVTVNSTRMEAYPLKLYARKAHKDRGPGFAHSTNDNCEDDPRMKLSSNQKVIDRIDTIPECGCDLGEYDE